MLPLLASLALAGADSQPLDGNTFAAIASQSTNVMKLHNDFLKAQSDYDIAAVYALFDAKSAQLPILMNDGQTFHGGVVHEEYGLGLGFGHPHSSAAVFAGAQFDVLRTGSFPLGNPVLNFHAQRQDMLVYGGFGIKGFQVDYGWRRTTRITGLDGEGEFIALPETAYRDGTPSIVADPTAHDVESSSFIVSAYEAHGVGIGALFADLLPSGNYTPADARKKVLAALHSKFEPADLFGEGKGNLGFGLDRYAPGVDYYDEEGDGAQRPDSAGVGDGAERPEATRPSWEIPLGGRGIGGTGFDLRLTPEVSPTIRLRQTEVGGKLILSRMVFGGRWVETNRNGHFEPSFDAYWQGQRVYFNNNFFSAFVLAVSYSYNSPDPSLFVPFARGHVIGVQVSIGIPAIHPINPALASYRSPQYQDWLDGDRYEVGWRGEEAPLEVAPPSVPPEPPPNVVPKGTLPEPSGLGDAGATEVAP
jgi:hypothetical protein